MSEIADFVLHRGSDTKIWFTGTANGSVAGWSTEFNLFESEYAATAALTIAGAIEDVGSAGTPGVFSATVTKAQSVTLRAKPYFFSFKRTNAGAESVITEGRALVRFDSRTPLT